MFQVLLQNFQLKRNIYFIHQIKLFIMFCYIKYWYKILCIQKSNILQYKHELYIYIG